MKNRLIWMVCSLITLFAIGSASATQPAGSPNNYLALGDSIVFGYITEAGYDYYYPTNFVGYGDWDSLALGLNLANGGCPGETTGSFLSRTAPDNGCRAYRALFPLHVIYPSVNATQLTYATTYLKQHTSVALVTIQLGANDILLLEEQCNNDPTCIANGAPQVFATAEANMTASLAALRATGYSGPDHRPELLFARLLQPVRYRDHRRPEPGDYRPGARVRCRSSRCVLGVRGCVLESICRRPNVCRRFAGAGQPPDQSANLRRPSQPVRPQTDGAGRSRGISNAPVTGRKSTATAPSQRRRSGGRAYDLQGAPSEPGLLGWGLSTNLTRGMIPIRSRLLPVHSDSISTMPFSPVR